MADALLAPLDTEKLRDVAAVFSLTDFHVLHCRKESLARSLGPLISYSGWRDHKPGGVGRNVDTLEVRIDSADARAVPGEILVKGANVKAGYYKNPDATAAAIDADGWLHSEEFQKTPTKKIKRFLYSGAA